ncbi:MAG: DUF904 domain-containing protein [Desulfobacula sp.]|nr:DUF904 domain-containing protein [Desulfobacula sp.]
MGNDLFNKKFDDIDAKIDLMLDRCQALLSENSGLKKKIKDLEAELDMTNDTEKQFSEQEAVIQLKIDGLLDKLNQFSNYS